MFFAIGGAGESAADIWWVEDRDAAICPIVHRTPHNEEFVSPQMSTVLRLRNPRSRSSHMVLIPAVCLTTLWPYQSMPCSVRSASLSVKGEY